MTELFAHPRLEEVVPDRPFTGQVWYKLERPGEVAEYVYIGKNIITNDASILVARLVADPAEPSSGAFALAVGTGDTGWDLQSVPAAVATQGSLYAEIDRKQFSSIDFIDSGGVVSAIPTNILDFTVTFSVSEAVGPLVEMGIVCAAVDTTVPLTATPIAQGSWNSAAVDRRSFDTFLNVRNYNVINKPGTMTLTLLWRVTF